MKRIICVGNVLRDGDRAGAEALGRLRSEGAPPGVELVDGGLAGLDLLEAMEGTERVVFVDSVRGFGAPGEVVVLSPGDLPDPAAFDHAAGLPYLLGVYSAVLAPPLPFVTVVGIEEPSGEASVEQAVRVALSLCSEVADAALAP